MFTCKSSISKLIFLFLIICSLSALASAKEEPKEIECATEEKPKGPVELIPFALGDCGSVTFKPGFLIQTRYTYDQETHNNDFFIRRFRMRAGGDAFGLAKYYLELKIDNIGRHHEDPKAKAENAWVEFAPYKDVAYIRVGLFDLPFSRNALTPDAVLLFMDRSLIKEALTEVGLADNTIGILLHGRPYGGHLEYAVGVFDNEVFEKIGSSGTKESDELMTAGRLVWNFLDPAKPGGYRDYQGSYLCKGHRFALGINGAYLGSAKDDDEKFDLCALGGDLFYNYRRFTFQAEYDWYKEHHKGYGWYVQAGYLFYGPFEIATCYQELRHARDDSRGKICWTSVGLNVYIREFNLKVQTDYTFKKEQKNKIRNDVFQAQLQFAY